MDKALGSKILTASLVTVLLMSISVISMAQFGGEDIEEYTASNGVTYKKGDNIKLGIGSAPNGRFLFLTMRSVLFLDPDDEDVNTASKTLAGSTGVIKKIKRVNNEKVYFVLGGLTAANWALMIEEAIAKCEVADCKKDSTIATGDKYDKLKKLKELLDMGAINQEEFDIEKKKILVGN